MQLFNKPLGQGSLRKSYGRYGDLIKQYEPPPPSRLLHDIREDDHTMTPSIDQTFHQFFTLLLISTLLPNLTFCLIKRGFHRTFAMRHANRGRLLLRTPGPVPLWDLHEFKC